MEQGVRKLSVNLGTCGILCPAPITSHLTVLGQLGSLGQPGSSWGGCRAPAPTPVAEVFGAGVEDILSNAPGREELQWEVGASPSAVQLIYCLVILGWGAPDCSCAGKSKTGPGKLLGSNKI